MSLRVIEIAEDENDPEQVDQIAAEHGAIDTWRRGGVVFILYEAGHDQGMLDALQSHYKDTEKWRIIVYPVEAAMPLQEDTREKISSLRRTLSREELFKDVEEGARLDWQYGLLVLLSVIVAAIGLLQDNVAVVIGAMVIAPLLGPNLALSFATMMGDRALILQSIKALGAGLFVSLLSCFMLGVFWNGDMTASDELMARTVIGFDVPVLALASGAAAVLSMTGGVSSALVGVMVAVALLPPAAAGGLLAGAGEWTMALRAVLMLVTNIVCINIAAQLVFRLKGIKPRTWIEKRSAIQSIRFTWKVWIVMLGLVLGLIFLLNTV